MVHLRIKMRLGGCVASSQNTNTDTGGGVVRCFDPGSVTRGRTCLTSVCVQADLNVVLPVRSSGPSRVCPSTTKTFEAALRSCGYLGRDRHRNQGVFGAMVRGVSNVRDGSKILSFLFQPRLVCRARSYISEASGR
jgi:hypothetical protein